MWVRKDKQIYIHTYIHILFVKQFQETRHAPTAGCGRAPGLKRAVSNFRYKFQMSRCVEIKLNVFIEAHNPRVLSHKAQHLKLISKIGNRSFKVTFVKIG